MHMMVNIHRGQVEDEALPFCIPPQGYTAKHSDIVELSIDNSLFLRLNFFFPGA